MDRYLFSGALGALILQLFLLLADVGIIEVSFWKTNAPATGTKVIGTLVEKRASVKRKASSSIVWEDSSKDDRLYSFDSILTLDHSSARITLDGDIKINLQENTLVMLEPLESNANDPLKIRFNYGQFSSRSVAGGASRSLKVGTGEWSVEAKPGAEISLQSLEGDQVQVEVHSGEVTLKKSNGASSEKLDEGARVVLDKSEIAQRETLVEEMKFIFGPDHIQGTQKIYTHTFPFKYDLKWSGTAKELRVILPDRRVEHLPLSTTDQEKTLPLWAGAYTFALVTEDAEGNTLSSDALHVNVLPAPKIRYTYPLPRERVILNEGTDLSWFKLPDIEKYRVEIVGESANEVSQPSSRWENKNTGRFFWQVYGVDPDGFEIPPHYSNEIFSVQDPLSAPRLHAPVKKQIDPPVEAPRVPAEQPPDKKPGNGAFYKILNLLFPTAHAETPIEAPPTPQSRQLVFSWFPVEGADFYIIEISSTADFLKPEVNEKVNSAEYIWRGFKSDIYYWRVAAGQNNGRMGLFSEVGTLDVRKLKNLSAGELVPGVKYIPEKVPVAVPAKAAEPAPVTEPVPAKVAEPVPVAVAVPVIVPEKAFEENAPLRVEVHAGAVYRMSVYNNSDIKSDFSGFADGGIGVRVGHGDSRGWAAHVDSVMSSYVPKNKNTIPYQPEQNLSLFEAKFLIPSRSYKHWSLIFSQKPRFSRTGLESISVKAQNYYGLGHMNDFYRSADEKNTFTSGLFLLRGGEQNSFIGNLQHQYILKPENLTSGFTREELRFEYFAGDGKSYSDTSLRLYFGWKW